MATEAPQPPLTAEAFTKALDRIREQGGQPAINDAIAEYKTSVGISPESRLKVVARATELLGAATATPATVTNPARVTIITNRHGPQTKRHELQPDGTVKSTAAATLYEGDYGVIEVAGPVALAGYLARLGHNQALIHGVARDGSTTGSLATVKAVKAGAQAKAISNDHFSWGDRPSLLMCDDDRKDAPERLQVGSVEQVVSQIVGAVPGLATAPMLAIPSAGSNLFRTDGTQLRGLTGTRLYFFTERAADTPEIGRRISDRLILAGYGYAKILKNGKVRIVSVLDDAVWHPTRQDFISGAICGPGLEQRRGEPLIRNEGGKLLTLADVPALDEAERAKLAEITASVRTGAETERQRVRAEYIAQLKAAGLPTDAVESDDEMVALRGDFPILLTNGLPVTVREILADPAVFHGQTCADPLEPDYAGDHRISKIFSNQPTPIIHSNAHSGMKYVLLKAAEDEFDTAAPCESEPQTPPVDTAPVFATLAEEIASLLQDAARPYLFASRDVRGAENLIRLWDALQLAAATVHPLAVHFQALVQRVTGIRADEEARFRLLARARVAGVTSLRQLPTDALTTLITAAFVLLAPLAVLDGSSVRIPRLVTRSRSSRQEIVAGLVPERVVMALVGPPGNGKSSFRRKLAVAAGGKTLDPIGVPVPRQVAGRTVMDGTVAMCISEDEDGEIAKLDAQTDRDGDAPHVHVISGVPNLSDLSQTIAFTRQAVSLMPKSAPRLRLFFIDVFRDAFVGDENSSEVVGAAMASARAIANMFDVTVCLVHHAGRADAERSRGSTAFDGALDLSLSVVQHGDTVTVQTIKNRGGPKQRLGEFHFGPGGVLLDGPAASTASSEATDTDSNAEEDALTIAQIVHEEKASRAQPITRKVIVVGLSQRAGERFSADRGVSYATAQSRVRRGLSVALAKGWVAGSTRRGFWLGSEQPGILYPTKDDVLDIELGGAA